MARTKQAARKVTGDKAPGLNFNPSKKKKSKAALASKKPTFWRKSMANSFCVMCRNGGDLWICDEEDCKRVVCYKYLIVPEDSMKKVTEDGVTFKCASCHWKETEKSAPQPYFGFYSQGKPVLSEPPVITGGSPFHCTHPPPPGESNGWPYPSQHDTFPPPTIFSKKEVPILSITIQPHHPKSMDAYQSAAFVLANSLSSYQSVILFLTTHSDEEGGDLFAGIVEEETVASEVFEVLQALFTPFTQIIKVAHIFFNVCGSVVTVKDSFNGLKKAAQLFKPKSMVLFDAQHLHLATTIPYLLSLVDSTIIQGFDVSSTVKFALNDCAMLGRDSNIIVMMWRSQGENMEVGKLVVEKLVWTDKFIRPWGEQLASPMSSVWKHPEVVATWEERNILLVAIYTLICIYTKLYCKYNSAKGLEYPSIAAQIFTLRNPSHLQIQAKALTYSKGIALPIYPTFRSMGHSTFRCQLVGNPQPLEILHIMAGESPELPSNRCWRKWEKSISPNKYILGVNVVEWLGSKYDVSQILPASSGYSPG
ncbi:hypothetical protein EDC04DRAFT_2607178 [Pisolithus marmoratus]|nr:hypothetical protein EDC04DRAFT_2607178 [Pisolithus marmoratus]